MCPSCWSLSHSLMFPALNHKIRNWPPTSRYYWIPEKLTMNYAPHWQDRIDLFANCNVAEKVIRYQRETCDCDLCSSWVMKGYVFHFCNQLCTFTAVHHLQTLKLLVMLSGKHSNQIPMHAFAVCRTTHFASKQTTHLMKSNPCRTATASGYSEKSATALR